MFPLKNPCESLEHKDSDLYFQRDIHSLTHPLSPTHSTISLPFPTHRLAAIALRALRVDEELSPLVVRSFSLAGANPTASHTASPDSDSNNPRTTANINGDDTDGLNDPTNTILVTSYKATTNRMLRVAVNGFMESIGVVLDVMQHLDVDVLQGQLQEHKHQQE